MRLLVFLQCAYGTTVRRRRQYKNEGLWLRALWESHTGKRLREMVPDGLEVFVANATPEIGDCPFAVFPPDAHHIQLMVEQIAPDVILACGKVAQRGLEEAGFQYIAAPHPAWRALTKESAAEVREAITRRSIENGELDTAGTGQGEGYTAGGTGEGDTAEFTAYSA